MGYMEEVKAIEKADAVLTPKQQIDRLNRPGSKYFNLNPFDVLQVYPDTENDDIRKKYRKLSILVHPDKNTDNKEMAQKAFDAVKKSWETLNNEKARAKRKQNRNVSQSGTKTMKKVVKNESTAGKTLLKEARLQNPSSPRKCEWNKDD